MGAGSSAEPSAPPQEDGAAAAAPPEPAKVRLGRCGAGGGGRRLRSAGKVSCAPAGTCRGRREPAGRAGDGWAGTAPRAAPQS